MLRSLGTALLTGARIASVVIDLAARSTLGNLARAVVGESAVKGCYLTKIEASCAVLFY